LGGQASGRSFDSAFGLAQDDEHYLLWRDPTHRDKAAMNGHRVVGVRAKGKKDLELTAFKLIAAGSVFCGAIPLIAIRPR